jgi:hypothetical protein
VRWHRAVRQLSLNLVLVLVLGGIVVAAISMLPRVSSTAVTAPPTGAILASPAESEPANPWLSDAGIERAVALRKSFGLRTDDAWIRSVANNPEALTNVTRYSIPITNDEVAHIADRDAVLADLEQFRTSHLQTWGGYYIDGDAIVVLLIDPVGTVRHELSSAVPVPLLVKPARWSLRALNDLATRVADDPWLQTRYHLLSAGADVEHNRVALEVSSTDRTVPATIAAHFGLGDELTVTIDGTGEQSGPPNG